MSAASSPSEAILTGHRSRTGTLLGLLLLTALLRGIVGWALSPQLAEDPDGYRLIANNLVERRSYSTSLPGQTPAPTAYRPPLYPLVLAGSALGNSVSSFSIGMLHLALGMGTIGLTWYLGHRWGLARGATLAALLALCDPLLLYQSNQVMTETLATCLVMVGLVALTRLSDRCDWQSAGYAGAALGLSSLCRPTLLAWFLLSCTVCLILPIPRARKLACMAAFGLAGASVLAPWTIRNNAQFKRPIVTTTHGGYTLHLANNASFYRHLEAAPWGQIWDARNLPDIANNLEPPKFNTFDPAGELERDRLHYQAAWTAMRDTPRIFAWSCVVRLGRLWRLAPHQTSADEPLQQGALRLAVGTWYAGLFCLAIVGLWKLRWEIWKTPWVWGVLLTLVLTGVHTLYWSNLRMRAPVTPFLCLLAATGATNLWTQRISCKAFSNR